MTTSSKPSPAKRRERRSRIVQSAARFRGTMTFVRNSAIEAQRTRLPQMAAALSFRTIFGLIPAIFIALVALQFFISEDDVSDALGRALDFTGLSTIAVEDVHSIERMGPFPEGWVDPSAQAATQTRAELEEWITTLIERIGSINFRAVSIIGLGALIYAAIAMLVEIERSFNQIFRVPIGRSWPRRIAQYWTLLTLGAIFLAATFYIGQQVTMWIIQRGADAAADDPPVAIPAAAGYLATVVISTVLLLLAYTIVPNTRVRLLPALGGAFVAAVLWETGKWGFTQYLAYSAGYARLYGTMALLPLFLLWVYITWLIVLFGLSTSYYLQNGRRLAKQAATDVIPERARPTIVDPGAILSIMLLLARRFEDGGRPADAATLAKELSLPSAIASQMLQRLVDAGFVHPVAIADDAGAAAPTSRRRREAPAERFALARPPDQIEAESVLNLAEGLVCPLSRTVLPVSECLRRARHEAVRGRSLADFSSDQAAETPQAAVG